MGLPARDILARNKMNLQDRDFDFEQLDRDRNVINLYKASTQNLLCYHKILVLINYYATRKHVIINYTYFSRASTRKI